jgi:hypothetical protein
MSSCVVRRSVFTLLGLSSFHEPLLYRLLAVSLQQRRFGLLHEVTTVVLSSYCAGTSVMHVGANWYHKRGTAAAYITFRSTERQRQKTITCSCKP